MKLQVTVKPNARQQRIVEHEDGSLTVQLTSPPTEGKANAELIKLLAKTYGVPKSRVTIRLGQTSRQKLVEIETE